MSLRKSPNLTPALLAACRANAKKSTGPATPQAKARVSLNGLKHGGYAVRLRERILQVHGPESDAQYRWFRSEIARTFHADSPAAQRLAERLAARAWVQARRAERQRTKHECGLFSGNPDPPQNVLLQIRIEDRRRGIGLIFWRQQRRYWTLDRLLDLLTGEDPSKLIAQHGKLEERWRRRKGRVRALPFTRQLPAGANH